MPLRDSAYSRGCANPLTRALASRGRVQHAVPVAVAVERDARGELARKLAQNVVRECVARQLPRAERADALSPALAPKLSF